MDSGEVNGWEMMQDDSWSSQVSDAMTGVAKAALDYNAGSAATSGLGDNGELKFMCAVLLVDDTVVGHYVNVADGNQLWGTRTVDSLT